MARHEYKIPLQVLGPKILVLEPKTSKVQEMNWSLKFVQ